MDAGFTPTTTPYQLHYSTYIQLTWSRLDMNDEGGLWPSALKTFYLYWREWDKSKRFCLITVTRLLLGCFYFFFPTIPRHVTGLVAPRLNHQVALHKLIGQSGSGGATVGGGGTWGQDNSSGLSNWTRWKCTLGNHCLSPVKLLFYFFVFLFLFFSRYITPAFPGGKCPLTTAAQSFQK